MKPFGLLGAMEILTKLDPIVNHLGLQHNRPNANTPQELLKWFVVVEERGFKLFENDISDLVLFEESHACDNTTKFDSGTNMRGDNLFFDNKGVEPANDDMETAEVAFLIADHSMKTHVSKKRRKQRSIWIAVEICHIQDR